MLILLILLEIALSLDNALLNAKILATMPPIWQKRFLYFGLPIAIFGMRLLFPMVLVSLTTSLNSLEVLRLAIEEPQAYAQAMQQGMPLISAFGGGFLLMVFFHFFIEKFSLKLKFHVGIPILIVSLIGLVLSFNFFDSYALGMFLSFFFQLLGKFAQFLSKGLLGFLYLEILDASFSFDGVLGAFALTQNIVVIAVGLGIGAFFVRSFTVWMLKHQIFQRWKYLNDGAHWTILLLGVCILLKNFYAIPEYLIAVLSLLVIGVSISISRIMAR